MGTEIRNDSNALKDSLLKESRKFSFIQAIRILRYYLASIHSSGSDESYGDEKFNKLIRQRWRNSIRVRPELSLAFPGTDIVSISEFDGESRNSDTDAYQFLIEATFLGLYGASSPLPTFYTDDLLEENREDSSVSRDFIDIINAPLYSLLFQCWTKYRLAIKIFEEQNSAYLEQLFCLIGLGEPKVRASIDKSERLIRYSGLFTLTPRSAMGLQILLAGFLEERRLKVVSNVPRKAVIPDDQLCCLGLRGHQLGNDTYLGRRIKDRMGKFRIQIGPINWSAYLRYLPDSIYFRRITELINVYLDQPLLWELVIELGAGEVRPAMLGVDSDTRLGWTSWIFCTDDDLTGSFTFFEGNLRG